MDALKFIEERNRMCERYWQVDGDCDGCPMVNVSECNELRNMVDDFTQKEWRRVFKHSQGVHRLPPRVLDAGG